MEHSTLHALHLIGLLLTLAAPILMLALVLPGRAQTPGLSDARLLAGALGSSAASWAFRGALVACAATVLDLAVQVSEIKNTTLFAGIDPALVWRFATGTTVGRLASLRAVFLAGAALLALSASRTGRSDGRSIWFGVGLLALLAVVTSGLVSHAAARPTGRAIAILVQVTHLIAGAAWIGVLGQLALASRVLRLAVSPGALALVARVIGRFSPLALASASLLAASGLAGAKIHLAHLDAAPVSAYGLTLAIKLALLVPVLAAGFVNFRRVRPALFHLAERELSRADSPVRGRGWTRSDPADVGPSRGLFLTANIELEQTGEASATLHRLCRMLELEFTLGVLVIAVAGILGSVSPPGEDRAGMLTPEQVTAIVTPRLPTTRIADPATWVGSETRTDDDLRYSEFMHNWSGLAVVLLGLAWLAQSASGGNWSRIAGRLWPAALVPFALFIALASDPEVWPLGSVSPWVALTDPVVLEHRIGAAMVLVLAWLGWREERRGEAHRPLGRALPCLMIIGSLLLLGHAHSSLRTGAESLSTLINVQHAVLGGLALLAGTVRWLQLRQLFPQGPARLAWPALIVLLGLFMALCYRELV